MRFFLSTSLFLLFFSSCLVVKVYESPKPQLAEKPLTVQRSMIGSGKKVDIGVNGSHEILFFGEEVGPKAFFLHSDKKELDSIKPNKIWIQKSPKKSVIITTDSLTPLIVIDGQIRKEANLMNSLDPNTIESINVLKGASAEEQYGNEGKNGVIEITLKKQ